MARSTTTTELDPVFLPSVAAELIHPSDDNPRSDFTDDSIAALAESIAQQGVLEPLLVVLREGYDLDAERPQFDLIAGHRRLAAVKLAEKKHKRAPLVPVLVRSMDAPRIAQARLVENLHRSDLNPIEEARGLRELVVVHRMTQQAVSKAIGRNQGHVSKRLKLLTLIPAAQEAVEQGSLGTAAGYELAALPEERQAEVIEGVGKSEDVDMLIRSAKARQEKLDQLAVARKALDDEMVAYIEIATPAGAEKEYDYENGPLPASRTARPLIYDTLPAWEEHHRTLPCSMAFLHHYAIVGATSSDDPVEKFVQWGCTDPAGHRDEKKVENEGTTTPATEPVVTGQPGATGDPEADERARAALEAQAAQREAFRQQQEADRREREEAEQARIAAEQSRREFIGKLLAGKSPKGAGEHLQRALLIEGLVQRWDGLVESTYQLAAQLLGLDPASDVEVMRAAATQVDTPSSKDALLRWALALRLAADERAMEPQRGYTYGQPQEVPGPVVVAHLDFLVSLGYEMTPHDVGTYEGAASLDEVVNLSWPAPSVAAPVESDEVDDGVSDVTVDDEFPVDHDPDAVDAGEGEIAAA